MRPAARQNFAAGASDPGSLPDKVLRDRRARCSFKKRDRFFKDVDHAIDFLAVVIKIEARARRSREAETFHERLIAMVPAAQRQPVTIRKRREVVRMGRVHDETDY